MLNHQNLPSSFTPSQTFSGTRRSEDQVTLGCFSQSILVQGGSMISYWSLSSKQKPTSSCVGLMWQLKSKTKPRDIKPQYGPILGLNTTVWPPSPGRQTPIKGARHPTSCHLSSTQVEDPNLDMHRKSEEDCRRSPPVQGRHCGAPSWTAAVLQRCREASPKVCSPFILFYVILFCYFIMSHIKYSVGLNYCSAVNLKQKQCL